MAHRLGSLAQQMVAAEAFLEQKNMISPLIAAEMSALVKNIDDLSGELPLDPQQSKIIVELVGRAATLRTLIGLR